MNKVTKYMQEVMEEMEKREFTQGDVEYFIRIFEEEIKMNNERVRKAKPFIVHNSD